MNLCSKFHPNRKVFKLGGKLWGEIQRKKMQTRRMKSQNESIEEVSSISDNGKVFKIRVREKFREKKMQRTQMPFYTESIQAISSKSNNRKVFKIRSKIGDRGKIRNLLTDFSNTGFEISFFDTMDISFHTQSEQRRVAGNNLRGACRMLAVFKFIIRS